MHLKNAALIVNDYERNCTELQWSAQPDVAGAANIEIRTKVLLIATSHTAVYAVCGYQQIAFAGKLFDISVGDFALKLQAHAYCAGARLQDVQQLLARDAAETVTA